MRPVRPSAAVRRIEQASLRPPLAPAPPDVVSLAMGEPDFATPEVVISAAATALEGGATHYADQHGLPALRAAIVRQIADATGAEFDPSEVLVTHGATAGLGAVILGLVDPGDRVVIPEPCYSLYPDLVHLAGGEPVLVPLDADLHWDRARLAAELEGARLFVYSNPCNPTGVVHGADELAWLAGELAGGDTLVLGDEAYDAIVFEPGRFRSALSVDGLRERTIYCQTLSKTYAMTGWRIGYLAGPGAAIAAAGRVHRTFNGSVNSAVQHAAITALGHGHALSDPMLAAYRERRALIMRRLERIPELAASEPDGTFYVFARYDLPMSSMAVGEALRAAGVIVRPGAEYGPSGEGHIRFAFTVGVEDLELAMDRVERCLHELSRDHSRGGEAWALSSSAGSR